MAAASGARDNRYWQETRSQNLTEAFRRLSHIDEPAAAAAASAIAAQCAMYSDHLFSRITDSIEKGQHPLEAKALQREAAARQRARCVGFNEQDINEGVRRGAYLRDLDDPRRFAGKIRTSLPEGPFARANEAVALRDPSAIQEVGAYFLNRYDRGRTPTYDLGGGVVATPRMMYSAFMLAACDFGDDCGRDHPFVIAQCVNAGRCNAANMEEVLVRYFHPGVESDRFLAARQIVSTGLQTGRWPPGLWAPPPEVPPYIRQMVEEHERERAKNPG